MKRSDAGAPLRDTIAELKRSMARPARARLDEARSVVGATRAGAPAWERLNARGLIPDDWFGDDARLFAPTRVARFGSMTERAVPTPPNAEVAMAMASDVPGVIAAESLARELSLACVPWAGRGPARPTVVWRVGVTGTRSYVHGSVMNLVDAAMDRAWLGVEQYKAFVGRLTAHFVRDLTAANQRRVDYATYQWRVAGLLARRQVWRALSNGGFTVPPVTSLLFGIRGTPTALGARFADLREPYSFAIGIYELGYCLEEWDERAVCLLAPPLPA